MSIKVGKAAILRERPAKTYEPYYPAYYITIRFWLQSLESFAAKMRRKP